MKESSNLWLLIKGAWSSKPGMCLTRIENAASSGIPDVNGHYQGVDFWLESKIWRGGSFDLRPSQKAWFVRAVTVQRPRCFVLTRSEDDDSIKLWKPYLQEGELRWYEVFRTQRPYRYDELLHRVLG